MALKDPSIAFFQKVLEQRRQTIRDFVKRITEKCDQIQVEITKLKSIKKGLEEERSREKSAKKRVEAKEKKRKGVKARDKMNKEGGKEEK